ncbi:MAG: AGE family epimerase/isomerase [Candidatus Helarchaeota archaeon]|nr:AGE family epimerase/isomerase [Candidatus Helarchaeota archaeon]
MHPKKKKVLVITLIVVSIISWIVIINELEYNYLINESNYPKLIVNHLKRELWDSDNSGFYKFHFDNGTISDEGLNKYTSFNIWTVRALLHYEIAHEDDSTFDTHGMDALNFIFNYLQNKTNKGFYHWVYQNGSIPAMGHVMFNNSVLQIATYQAWVLLTITDFYRYTLNETYIDVWGNQTANFLITKLWDSTYGGFYSEYLPFHEEITDRYKYTWYQAWPALALMDYYEITGNETYMTYANTTLNFMITNLWDSNLKGFVFSALENGTINATTEFTLTDQAAAVLALSKATNITGNLTYWNDYLVPLVNFTKNYLWDDECGQFYSACDINGTNPDATNRPSDLSIWLFALSEVIDSLNDTSLEDLLTSSTAHLNSIGWDGVKKAFNRKFFNNGTVINLEKWTIEQAIPLFFYSQYFQEIPTSYILIYVYVPIFAGTIFALAYIYLKFGKKKDLTRKKLK